MNRHANNFDVLRLVGAGMVILGHSSATLGLPAIPLLGLSIETLGVSLFFSISGWLIVDAWERNPRILDYLRNRSLRIFPALIVVVLVTTFVIGPIATTSTAYWSDPRTWSYLTNIVLWTQHPLPGVFTENPFPLSVNGPLWTLPIEFIAYLAVPIAALIPLRGRAVAWFAVAAFWAIGYYTIPPITFFASALNFEGLLWVSFAIAGGLRVLALRRPGLIRTEAAVLVLAAHISLLVVFPERAPTTTAILLPYLVIAIGTLRTPVLWRAARFGDFSYGLYLWGFLVQQVLVAVVVLPQWIDAIAVLLITLPIAAASWWLVERPALKLKAGAKPTPRLTAGRPELLARVSSV